MCISGIVQPIIVQKRLTIFIFSGMSMIAKTESSSQASSENPLDVLSRAATMVEKSEIRTTPSPPSGPKKERSPSFKERHPKFRKSSTPDYLVALNLKRQTSIQSESENVTSNNNSEDLPLDMSIKKRPVTPPPPPPYNSVHRTTSPTHFSRPPPPYPTVTPSPPHGPPPLPPPPSYADATVKCTYPTKKTPPPPHPPAVLNNDAAVEEKTKIKEITIITSKF